MVVTSNVGGAQSRSIADARSRQWQEKLRLENIRIAASTVLCEDLSTQSDETLRKKNANTIYILQASFSHIQDNKALACYRKQLRTCSAKK